MSAETITSDDARSADLVFLDLMSRGASEDVAHLTAYHRVNANPYVGESVTYAWRSFCPFCDGPDDFAELLARHERRFPS